MPGVSAIFKTEAEKSAVTEFIKSKKALDAQTLENENDAYKKKLTSQKNTHKDYLLAYMQQVQQTCVPFKHQDQEFYIRLGTSISGLSSVAKENLINAIDNIETELLCKIHAKLRANNTGTEEITMGKVLEVGVVETLKSQMGVSKPKLDISKKPERNFDLKQKHTISPEALMHAQSYLEVTTEYKKLTKNAGDKKRALEENLEKHEEAVLLFVDREKSLGGKVSIDVFENGECSDKYFISKKIKDCKPSVGVAKLEKLGFIPECLPESHRNSKFSVEKFHSIVQQPKFSEKLASDCQKLIESYQLENASESAKACISHGHISKKIKSVNAFSVDAS